MEGDTGWRELLYVVLQSKFAFREKEGGVRSRRVKGGGRKEGDGGGETETVH